MCCSPPRRPLPAASGRLLRSLSISHCVIDEAHCISEWGDRFRPAYVELGAVIRAAGIPVVSAFTATASAGILRRIQEVIYADAPVSVVSVDPDRTNLRYAVRQVLSKKRALVECAETMARPLIAFASSRGGTEHYARHLQAAGIASSRFYHAGLDADERRAIEQWFFDSADGVLVATSAYGMGVDKGDLRTAIHLDPPPSIEAYLQEAGRAGRDGRSAQALLLHAGGAERRGWNQMAPADRRRYAAVLDYACLPPLPPGAAPGALHRWRGGVQRLRRLRPRRDRAAARDSGDRRPRTPAPGSVRRARDRAPARRPADV